MRSLIVSALCAAASAGTYHVDKTGVDKVFNGLGGLSGGGATSRLLVDYQEPQRSQVLDYLFKPNFGASLQILKVEIGGDSQSTDGTETSHMHSKDDLDVTRGYEWWLMVEAKKRNPDIKLYGLPWAFPGWVGDDPKTGKPSGSPFTYPNQTSTYITEWVKGAKNHYDLDIDYIGIWNERSSSAAYAASLKKTLADEGFGKVQLVAKDGSADICEQMAKDPAYNASIDIIGLHYPSDYKNYKVCHSLNKPFWASEESSSYDDYNGAACWARVVTSHYVLSGMTASIMWNLVGSYYHGTNWYGSSMLTANQPWTGYVENLEVAYATAHITQFTKIGWRYLKNGSGSGKLSNGGYYTTFASEDSKDFTIVIVKISHEHAPCTRPGLPYEAVSNEIANITINANMGSQSELFFWRSNFEQEQKMQFEQQPKITLKNGMIANLPVVLGDVLTISTISTGNKGSYPNTKSDARFPLPHSDDFEKVALSQEAPLCTDQIGAFEVHQEEGKTNKIMKQMVREIPIGWSDHGSRGPMTLIGMKEWQDVTVQIDIKLPSAGAAGCVATRVSQMWREGVAFCVGSQGRWNLTYEGPPQNGVYFVKPIATGVVEAPGVGNWFNLMLTTVNESATVAYNNKTVQANIPIRNFDNGFAAFGSNKWYAVEYDNLSIRQAGDNWTPKEVCPAAKIGTKVTTRPCVSNGLTSSDMKFFLSSDYQTIHVDSGLCVTADDAKEHAGLTLQKCVYKNRLQSFRNDYTTIRNRKKVVTLSDTLLNLVGFPNGAEVSTVFPAGGWERWSYFPNTFQLRNIYDTDVFLGYPQCLSACH